MHQILECNGVAVALHVIEPPTETAMRTDLPAGWADGLTRGLCGWKVARLELRSCRRRRENKSTVKPNVTGQPANVRNGLEFGDQSQSWVLDRLLRRHSLAPSGRGVWFSARCPASSRRVSSRARSTLAAIRLSERRRAGQARSCSVPRSPRRRCRRLAPSLRSQPGGRVMPRMRVRFPAARRAVRHAESS